MAKFYIREYKDMPQTIGNSMQMGAEPGVDQAPVAIGVEAKSAIFAATTKFVRVHTDAICSFKVGVAASTTADTNSARMAAGQTEFFGITPGLGHVISVISNT